MHAIIFACRCEEADKKLYTSAIVPNEEIACIQHSAETDPTRFKACVVQGA